MNLDLLPLLLGCCAALLVGLSKTGMPGVAIPAVAMMALAFGDDTRLSVGALLPVLLVGDLFAAFHSLLVPRLLSCTFAEPFCHAPGIILHSLASVDIPFSALSATTRLRFARLSSGRVSPVASGPKRRLTHTKQRASLTQPAQTNHPGEPIRGCSKPIGGGGGAGRGRGGGGRRRWLAPERPK